MFRRISTRYPDILEEPEHFTFNPQTKNMPEVNYRFKDLKSFSDIVDTMIRGLKRQWVEVEMGSYGNFKRKMEGFWIFKKEKKVCFGCAATNTICELMQEPFTPETITARTGQFNYGIKPSELGKFEHAIDYLRNGKIYWAHYSLQHIEHLFSFPLPSAADLESSFPLPELNNHNWKKNLKAYETYRDELRAKGL